MGGLGEVPLVSTILPGSVRVIDDLTVLVASFIFFFFSDCAGRRNNTILSSSCFHSCPKKFEGLTRLLPTGSIAWLGQSYNPFTIYEGFFLTLLGG